MIKTTIKFTRPSVDIPWYTDPSLKIVGYELMEYIMAVYSKTGKLLHGRTVESSDAFEMSLIGYWSDKESLEEYNKDQYINEIYAKRDDYYKTVGITAGDLIETVVDVIDPLDL